MAPAACGEQGSPGGWPRQQSVDAAFHATERGGTLGPATAVSSRHVGAEVSGGSRRRARSRDFGREPQMREDLADAPGCQRRGRDRGRGGKHPGQRPGSPFPGSGPSSPRCNLLGDGLRDLVDLHFGSRGRCQLRFPSGVNPKPVGSEGEDKLYSGHEIRYSISN